MATKINTSYYGTPENWTSVSAFNNHAKWSQYRFGALINDNKWDISAGDMPDRSIVPWGIPHCSISSMAYTISCRDGGRYKKIIHENDSGNTPLMFAGNYGGISYSAYAGATDTNARNRQKNRIVGETDFNNSNLIYTNTVDNGTVPDATQSGVQGYAMTYIDYQHIRTVMRSVRLGNFASKANTMPVKDVNFDVLKNQTDGSGEDWQLLSISPTIAIDSNTSAGSLICPTICAATTAPPHLANRYFDDTDTKMMNIYRRIFVPGCLETRLLTTLSSLPAYNDIISGAKTASFPVHNVGTQYQNISAKKQVFDDVSYHWDIHIRYGTGSAVTYYDDGDELPASNSNISVINHLVIDESIYSSKFEAIYHACLHELAFLGLPIVEVAGDLPASIGSNDVYLPIFDIEHMMTTGNYTSGTDSMRYINAYWGDIFADTVPDYDPDYEPPEPEPPTEDDSGDLNNKLTSYEHRYSNPNSIYAMSQNNFMNFVSDINGLYLSDPDDTQLKIDFKGSNPNDYVVGAYGIPFLCDYIVPSGPDTAVNVGPVTLPTAVGKLVDTSTSILRDCGSITVPALGDFRDYEPYSQYELYIPMCGTVQLDAAQVVGRTLHIEVYYDIMTMDCAAAVYRDAPDSGETLICTVNGTIGATLPLMAAQMGDYQNSVKTTQNALKQNEMRTALGVGGAVIGIAGAALAPETGGLSLALAGAAIAGVSTAASGAMTEKQLQYDLTHKQPAVSQCSAANGATAQLISTFYPHLFIKRAKMLDTYDADTYAKTVGYACCINTTVGAMDGLTVCSDVDLSNIPATATEIEMIRQKLQNGIYV